MIVDNNLIAYEYYKNQYVPKKLYYSGEKEETKFLNKYGEKIKEATILTLEDDIVDENGRGLKKGFYKISPDKHLDFLYFYQSGELKAKIPVVEMQVYESINAQKEQKVQKMSYKKYQKQQMKEYRKYLKGENPKEIEWSEAKIEYLKDSNTYMVIYSSNIYDLVGFIKI